MLNVARRVGLGVFALAAVAVWWLMAPDSEQTRRDFPGHYFDLVNTALEDAELNESFADSAPQQQVVNGWVARDLLAAIGYAQADTINALDDLRVRDDRPATLMLLAVLAICWFGISAPNFQEPAIQPVRGKHGGDATDFLEVESAD